MISKKTIFALCGVLLLGAAAAALADGNGMDPASESALKQTRQMLEDPTQRQQTVDQDSEMKKTDQNVRSLAGPNTDDVYRLSSQIMERITRESNGDPQKMQELIEKAKANPSAFADGLTDDEKAKLHDLGNRMTPQKP